MNLARNELSHVPQELSAAAECALSRLTQLQKKFEGKPECVRFDTDTDNAVMRFIDELKRIEGGVEEIEHRAAILAFQPPSENGQNLNGSWRAIRKNVIARHKALKPEADNCDLHERHLMGFHLIDDVVRFDDFLAAARNGRAPLNEFNLNRFRNSLSKSLEQSIWPKKWIIRLEKVLSHADSLWHEAAHVESEGCRLLWRLSGRQRELLPTVADLQSMITAINSLTGWVAGREATGSNANQRKRHSASTEPAMITTSELAMVRRVVRNEGKNASTNRIKQRLKLRAEKANFGLRILEELGEYSGFTRRPEPQVLMRVKVALPMLNDSVPQSSGN